MFAIGKDVIVYDVHKHLITATASQSGKEAVVAQPGFSFAMERANCFRSRNEHFWPGSALARPRAYAFSGARGFVTRPAPLLYSLFSLPAGALIDRWNRKAVMI